MISWYKVESRRQDAAGARRGKNLACDDFVTLVFCCIFPFDVTSRKRGGRVSNAVHSVVEPSPYCA
jgi:hypothetical protein